MMNRYEILKRFSYLPFLQTKKKPNQGPALNQNFDPDQNPSPTPDINHDLPFHFDDVEVERLNALWDSGWGQIVEASHTKNGVSLGMADGDHVHIRKDRVSIGAKSSDATLRALVLHAKENWNGAMTPGENNKNEEQLARVWAHCQVQGVKFAWQPSAEVAEKMQPLIAQLREDERTISYGLAFRPEINASAPIPRAGSNPNYAGLRAEMAATTARTPEVMPAAVLGARQPASRAAQSRPGF